VEEQDLGYGNKILGFGSYEEMQAYIEEQNASLVEAMKDLTPEQLSITFGGYAIRFVPHGDLTLAIFGHVFTNEEMVSKEVESGASSDELIVILSKFHQLYADGYRYGEWFSVICPEGEVGDAHVTTLWPITEADFEHAKNNRWDPPKYLTDRVAEEISSRKETE